MIRANTCKVYMILANSVISVQVHVDIIQMRYVSYLRIRTCRYNTNQVCFLLATSVISVQAPEEGQVPICG